MRQSRKDEHLILALKQDTLVNDFDNLYFEHTSLPLYDLSEIDLSTTCFGKTFKYPFYINAMTGGTKKTKLINEKLARLAKEYELAMAVGSQKIALDDNESKESFTIINKIYENGFFIGNLSANATKEDVLKAQEMIHASAFQIHLNPVQELAMAEGDRSFKHWKKNIETIVKESRLPIIIKEVGFGMSEKTLKALSMMNISYVDVSGKGGTNFAQIENLRNNRKDAFLEEVGISTVQSLNYAKKYPNLNAISSGGIRGALDIVKSLMLGAKAVGLSKFFLEVVQLEWEEQLEIMDRLIEDIKKIMVLVDAKKINDLQGVELKVRN